MKQLNNQKGFTLVEIAIVMVIIGLLLGGVLKGQQMIANAKIKNLVNHAKGLAAAIYTYQDRYKALPGDDPKATTNLAGTGCTGVANGNGDGLIYEYGAAPQHLACAGFITGTYGGSTSNADAIHSPYGTIAYIYYQTIQGKTGNLIRYDNLPPDVAKALDIELDDGNPTTGSIRANVTDYDAAITSGTAVTIGYYY